MKIMKIMKIKAIHPVEILNEEFLIPLGITRYRLSKDINVTPRRINEIVHGKRAITADTALRFAKYFGTSPEFWLNLQSKYELSICAPKLKKTLEKCLVYGAYNIVVPVWN